MAVPLRAQAPVPDWCRPLPRPEYKTIERVAVSDPWFEVYKPAPGVFAIYEPRQFEETISYLIVGDKRALDAFGLACISREIEHVTAAKETFGSSHVDDGARVYG